MKICVSFEVSIRGSLLATLALKKMRGKLMSQQLLKLQGGELCSLFLLKLTIK